MIIGETLIQGGSWAIGPDPSSDTGGIMTERKNSQVWPSQEKPWIYWDGANWLQDSLLTVSGWWKFIFLLKPSSDNRRETTGRILS